MATGEDWMPGDNLQAVRKELREMKEWLAAVQKKSVPLSPHPKTPTRPEPTSPPNAPRGQLEVGNQGNTVYTASVHGKMGQQGIQGRPGRTSVGRRTVGGTRSGAQRWGNLHQGAFGTVWHWEWVVLRFGPGSVGVPIHEVPVVPKGRQGMFRT